jgi:four helix bundle protein
MRIMSYKDLTVWRKSITLVEEIYKLTKEFPSYEQYGITSQIKRAAVSIPSNIAEGYGRRSSKEYKQFYSIAYGSALELETQIFISKRLKLAPLVIFANCESVLIEVIKMLYVLVYKNKIRV